MGETHYRTRTDRRYRAPTGAMTPAVARVYAQYTETRDKAFRALVRRKITAVMFTTLMDAARQARGTMKDRLERAAKKLRWRAAFVLNRLPNQCWADLVTWALGWGKGDKLLTKVERSPWSPVTSTCRSDLARTGTCYCGKLRRP